VSRAGLHVIRRVNARKDEDLQRIAQLLSDGYRVIHMVGFDTDTMLLVVLEAPVTYSQDAFK
jgi:hypothetical protein